MVHAAERPRKKGTRARRREETVARIVDAALVILTEEGFEALTMKRLADELGYAIGAFYRYFRSKDELLLAAQRRVLEVLASDLREADVRVREGIADLSQETAALTRLVAAARVYQTLATRRPAHFRLLSRWLGDPSPMVSLEAATPMMPVLFEMFGAVPAMFQEATAVGALTPGPADRRTYVLWSSLQGVMQLRKLARFGIEAMRPEALCEELYETLFTGWGASEPHLLQARRRARELVPGEREE